jgi:hypothetical protein
VTGAVLRRRRFETEEKGDAGGRMEEESGFAHSARQTRLELHRRSFEDPRTSEKSSKKQTILDPLFYRFWIQFDLQFVAKWTSNR